MLKNEKLLKVFRGEDVWTSCYLINRSSSFLLSFEALEKAWTRKDVSYSHLRVFRYKYFMHIPKEPRSKLDDKAIPYIHIGYRDEEFEFKF